jgi:hypothetical protein
MAAVLMGYGSWGEWAGRNRPAELAASRGLEKVIV